MHNVEVPRSSLGDAIEFTVANSQSLAKLRSLLASNKLPFSDIDRHIDHFVIATCGNEIVGLAGIEVHGRDGLLRSVCVDANCRNKRLGSELCDLVEAHARNVGVTQLYL